ncbi:MAG TPA: AMP-binding protein [Acidimicrobiales bacterium]|nr:AMP-binding protein [Acidimicrobiales bacterium]
MAPAVTDSWGLRDVPAELTARYRADGSWRDETLGQLLAGAISERPELTMKIRSSLRPWSGTFGDVFDRARRLAAALQQHGIGAGDVVAFQLPNWVEAAVTFWAAALVGAVVTPIVHFYGPKEVGYILRRTSVRALVTAERFGHQDYLASLDELRKDAPELELIAVVGDRPVPAWAVPFDSLLGHDHLAEPVAVDATAPALVAYTSGTTADPKGVVHSHRTIGFEIRQLSGMQSGNPPLLVGAPVGHGIGMLSGLLLPVWKREPIHLIDVWDPGTVLAAMVEDHVASGSGATYFLTSLLDHPDCGPEQLKLMSRIGLGGSPVPSAVTERMASLGISAVRSYGSTEHPSTTGSRHEEPQDKRHYTDGHPLQGVELRLVDEDGHEVPAGARGEILSRGPDCCIGYTEPTLTAQSFDADGWFATGDVGVLDEDGYLTIVDRKKDIIIRGGENISALEVEEVLLRIPGVAEAAVVAAPDARLGEHACAFLRLLPGAEPVELPAVRAHFEQAGVARQKWPEDLRTVPELPRTPSGKVKKFVLRQELSHEAREEPGGPGH